jgi:hypothetical protein
MVARPGAESEGDCLAEFGQLGETGAWYMGGAVSLTPVYTATTLEECVAACKSVADSSCQYLTFDYDAKTCYLKLNTAKAVSYAGLG